MSNLKGRKGPLSASRVTGAIAGSGTIGCFVTVHRGTENHLAVSNLNLGAFRRGKKTNLRTEFCNASLKIHFCVDGVKTMTMTLIGVASLLERT